eukprot:TRINITY_DN8875_c0_g1_i2.p2 TRINITY_DN8875_c0_g1~~TRINITY_DN8875_c0_g1_i2.p2  ORF type:complete len:200 (+),score=67.57 TRINITY_DN8875_c0_g1_i2:318-917(+)
MGWFKDLLPKGKQDPKVEAAKKIREDTVKLRTRIEALNGEVQVMKKACQQHAADCEEAINANPQRESHRPTLTKLKLTKPPKGQANTTIPRDLPMVQYAKLLQQRTKDLLDIEKPFWRSHEEAYNTLRVDVGLPRAQPSSNSSPPTASRTSMSVPSPVVLPASSFDVDGPPTAAPPSSSSPNAPAPLPEGLEGDLDDLI